MLLDNNLLKHITEETKLYSIQTTGKSINVTTDKMEQYLSILVRTTVTKLSHVRNVLDPKYKVSSISNIISINRFEKIRKYFHFNDNETNFQSSDPNYDTLYKVSSVMDSVLKKCLQILPEKVHRQKNHTY